MKNNSSRNLGFILMGIGALLVAVGIYGLTRPDEFRASARIIVFHRPAVNEVFVKSLPDIEAVKSEMILSNVVSVLDLASDETRTTKTNEPLNYTQAIATLRARVDVRLVTNTRLLEIAVVDKPPDRAAKYANAIAFTCKIWAFNTRHKLAKAGIADLENQLGGITQRVAAAEARLGQLKVASNIPSPEPSAQELRAKWPDYFQAKLQLEEAIKTQDAFVGKIKWEKHDLTVARSDCEIVETATPPTSPLRRTKLLGALLVTAGLVCFGWALKLVLNRQSFIFR